MNTNKNNFFAFPSLAIILFAMFLFSIFFLILAIRNDWKDSYAISISSILILIPLLIYFFVRVEVNSSGLIKRIFGIKVQFMNWEEVNQIEIISGGRTTNIIISKSRIQYRPIYINKAMRQLRKDDIYLMYKKKIIESINQFAPPRLLPIKNLNNIKQERKKR